MGIEPDVMSEQNGIKTMIENGWFPAKFLNTEKKNTEIWHAVGTGQDKILHKDSKSYLQFWCNGFHNHMERNWEGIAEQPKFSDLCNQYIAQPNKGNANDGIVMYSRNFFGMKPFCDRCRDIPLCAAFDCPQRAVHGAHVYDKSQTADKNWNICWIIPTCPEHNQSSSTNKHNYPLPWEAVNQADFNDPKYPNQILLKKGGYRDGMKIKTDTFAMMHVITKKGAAAASVFRAAKEEFGCKEEEN